ncbi:MAG TPA: phosphate ABC transporter permease subunit PstC [Acidimicrobiales bacterium]|nr:phosphate ABC transporter permease subunit PstC [Acidimicrobiales bacterium]
MDLTTRAPAPDGQADAGGPGGDGGRRPRRVVDVPTRTDRIFGASTTTAGLTVLALLTLTGLFLLLRSRDTFELMGWDFFTTVTWRADVDPPVIGVLGLVTGTVLVALVAVSIAIPLGCCTALFITDYSSRRWRSLLTSLVDLLASIPSLLYGLWGFVMLASQLVPVTEWLARHVGWFPLFRTTGADPEYYGSIFIAGTVVSLMVLPIVASVSREVFAQTPAGEKEAALALGGTRWGMVRMVVLPYGRSGVIGGSMLGLGRALGETIAVSLLLPQVPEVTGRILENGGATVSGFIAVSAGSGDPVQTSGLMAAGLVLFAMTLVTNVLASVIVARSRSGVGVEL